MKKIKFLATLLAAGALVACNETIEPQGSGENTPTTGEGYVKVAINMPTTSGTVTKSTDNGEVGANVDLEDGVASEYAVNNGMIVFFKAPSSLSTGQTPENTATFVKAYNITIGESASGPADQVTTRYSTITEAPLVGENEQLYALAILNVPSVISLQGDVLKINGTVITTNSNLDAFQTKLSSGITAFTANGITMTNAPLTDEAGTDSFNASNAKAYTLVPVTVYATEALAQANDATLIYVERIVAKVTLEGFDPTDDNSITVTGTDDKVKLEGWTLNVTNKTTKLVRDVTDFSSTGNGWLASEDSNVQKRFAGTSTIPANFTGTDANYYRIYWAEDCNYDGTSYPDEFTIYTSSTSDNDITWNAYTYDSKTSETDRAIYCLENTMNYDTQSQNETTGILIKTKYLTKFGTQDAAQEQDFFICGTDATKYPTSTIDEVIGFCDYVKDAASLSDNVAIKTDAEGGTYNSADELKNLIVKDDQSALGEADYTAIWDAIGTVYYYKDGTSYYYSALIRHFQDAEGVTHNDGTGYTLRHLGRYGVVRNNWYAINVQSISGPGEPEIPDTPDEPDDETEGYINCTINVLSWAKRSQDVDL